MSVEDSKRRLRMTAQPSYGRPERCPTDSKTNGTWITAKGLAIVFFGAVQCAVAQFAEFPIEDVVAMEERQHGGAAFFDSASGAFQAFVVAEQFQGGVEGIDGLGVSAGQLIDLSRIERERGSGAFYWH